MQDSGTDTPATTPPLAAAASLLSALSDPNAVRVLGWMLDRDPGKRSAVSACGDALGLDTASIARIYGRLTGSNLIASSGPEIEVRLGWLRQAAEDLDKINPVVRRLDDFPQVKALFSHGRLTSIPVEPKQRRSLARFLASFFAYGVAYNESAVSHLFRQVHEDFPALRRMMVDLGVMTRDGRGVYVLSEPS